MAESAAAIQTSMPAHEAAPSLPPPAAALSDSPTVADVAGVSFLEALVQSNLQSDVLGDSQANALSDATANGSLLGLNATTLLLLNETNINPLNTTTIGGLTPQQLQALEILQEDVQLLEQAATIGVNVPVASGATLVDLSAVAQSLVGGVGVTAAINSTSNVLTPAQLAQAAAILGPVANESLTPSLLLQIQAQLAAAELNPLQFNLNVIFMIMAYWVGLQPDQSQMLIANKVISASNTNQATVAPVAPADKNSAIHS